MRIRIVPDLNLYNFVGKREGPDHGNDHRRGETGGDPCRTPGQDQRHRGTVQQVSIVWSLNRNCQVLAHWIR